MTDLLDLECEKTDCIQEIIVDDFISLDYYKNYNVLWISFVISINEETFLELFNFKEELKIVRFKSVFIDMDLSVTKD